MTVGLWVAIIATVPVSAADFTACPAGCDFTTIAAAVASPTVADGDTIEWSGDLPITAALSIGKDLTIASVGDPGDGVIAVAAGPMVTVNAGAVVTLRGFTVGGHRTQCVHVDDGAALTLDDVIVAGCGGAFAGAGLAVDAGASAVLVDSLFSDNDSALAGVFHGPHAWTDGGDITATDTSFVDGRGGASGGVYVKNGSFVGTRVSATGNAADGSGGAIHGVASDLSCVDCSFIGNEAVGDGGAIYASSSSAVDLAGGAFSWDPLDGVAAVRGGAVYVHDGSITVDGTSFTDLVSSGNGGAVATNGAASATVTGARFERNEATGTGNGGGGWFGGTAGLTSSATTWRDNAAAGNGGALVSNGVTALEGDEFIGNVAGVYGGHVEFAADAVDVGSTFQTGLALRGGAVRIRYGGTEATFEGSQFVGNVASNDHGGAIQFEGGLALWLDGAKFTDNEAAKDGGHVWADSTVAATLDLLDSSFVGGSAGRSGGCVAADDFVRLTVSGGNFVGCSAINDGGALWWSPDDGTATASLTGTTLLANVADAGGAAIDDGGGIYATGGASLTVTDLTTSENIGGRGGGLAAVSVPQVDVVRWNSCGDEAEDEGGVAWVSGGAIDVANSIWAGAVSGKGGAALDAGGAVVSVAFSDIVFAAGDAVVVADGSASFDSNLVAWNSGVGIEDDGAGATVSTSAWFANGDHVGGDLGVGDLAGQLVDIDPTLIDASDDGDCNNDNLRPALGSPLFDAGNPAVLDGDGTRSDIGWTGGPDAPFDEGSIDADHDGAPIALDCDDGDPDVFPGAVETPADGIDSNCNGFEACYVDADGDGFGVGLAEDSLLDCSDLNRSDEGGDCDDADPARSPGALEVALDGVDSDCDGGEICALDADADGFGGFGLVASVDGDCGDLGESPGTTDCDDADGDVYPGRAEVVADGVDQDCDGGDRCWRDGDGDGFGVSIPVSSVDLDCLDGGESSLTTDCDDLDDDRFPGHDEVVDDGVDQDCSGADRVTCHVDADLDGVGGSEISLEDDGDCSDLGESTIGTDCDDEDPDLAPGNEEIPEDGIDQDCSGADLIGCYVDGDGDGVGTAAVMPAPDGDCEDPGESALASDCDDLDAEVFPGAVETCGDAVDSNCDGVGGVGDDEDGDGLSYAEEVLAGTTDCAGDTDSDGLFDGDEVALGTDGSVADTDEDGVLDGAEVEFGADPLSDDSDGDGIEDGVEFGEELGPVDSDGDTLPDLVDDDDDGDGLPTIVEGPADVDADGIGAWLDDDSDGDGVSDAVEGLDDIDGDTVPDFLDPDDSDGLYGDPDADGIITADEIPAGANPADPDTDGDGRDDGAEWDLHHDADGRMDALDDDDNDDAVPTQDESGMACVAQIWTEGGVLVWRCLDGTPLTPSWRDTDSDGVLDGVDADDDADGTDTRDEDVDGDGDPRDDDTDADGVANFLDSDDQDGPAGDQDGDGVQNGDEAIKGTDPSSADSDGDGLADGDEPGDTDGDGIPDALDPDDDGDGIPTAEERFGDLDGDGLPAWLDDDADGDGVDDAAERGLDDDCDGLSDEQDAESTDVCGTGAGAEPFVGLGCASADLSAPGLLGCLAALRRPKRRIP